MGSPLAPVLANIFMGTNEDKWINNYKKPKPVFYRRYVDDILAVFDNEQQAKLFFTYLNKQHKNIKFTMEININNQIPFLDTLISNIDKNLSLVSTSEITPIALCDSPLCHWWKLYCDNFQCPRTQFSVR